MTDVDGSTCITQQPAQICMAGQQCVHFMQEDMPSSAHCYCVTTNLYIVRGTGNAVCSVLCVTIEAGITAEL